LKTIPTIKVWCLPADSNEEQLKKLHENLVKQMSYFKESGVESENDMLNLFPSDLMKYGLGSEIKIEITDLPWACKDEMNLLAREICIAVRTIFPHAKIYCKAERVNPDAAYYSIE
jgi:hypothetical protein